MKTEREKMLAGELYNAGDAELCAARARARRLCRAFNTTPEEDGETRDALLRELLGSAGQDIYVESDFKCDYGCNIHVGENFYANFDVVILDCCEVHIGKNCMLAPRVCIYTATHPLDPYERNEIGPCSACAGAKNLSRIRRCLCKKGFFPWASNSVFLFETFEKGVEGNDSVS